MVLNKNHLKGWKTPRLCCPNHASRVRQKPLQMDFFWDAPCGRLFEYNFKTGRSDYVVSSQKDVSPCESPEL